MFWRKFSPIFNIRTTCVAPLYSYCKQLCLNWLLVVSLILNQRVIATVSTSNRDAPVVAMKTNTSACR